MRCAELILERGHGTAYRGILKRVLELREMAGKGGCPNVGAYSAAQQGTPEADLRSSVLRVTPRAQRPTYR